MTPVSHSSTGASGWFNLPNPGKYRVDIDVPAGVTAISYTIETKGPGATIPKIETKPNDPDSDWTLTRSVAVIMDGPGDIRANVASRTGTGNVVITGAQTE